MVQNQWDILLTEEDLVGVVHNQWFTSPIEGDSAVLVQNPLQLPDSQPWTGMIDPSLLESSMNLNVQLSLVTHFYIRKGFSKLLFSFREK